MIRIEELAEAAIKQDAFLLRSLTQDLLRESPSLRDFAQPATANIEILAVAASLIELFAQRLNQRPPAWTSEIGPLPEPMYLLKAAAKMKGLRRLCEQQAPEPLRKRRLYAPPNFLETA